MLPQPVSDVSVGAAAAPVAAANAVPPKASARQADAPVGREGREGTQQSAAHASAFAALIDAGIGSDNAAAPRTRAALLGDSVAAADPWLRSATRAKTTVRPATEDESGADQNDKSGAAKDQHDIPTDALMALLPGIAPPPAGWTLHASQIPVPGDEEADAGEASRTAVAVALKTAGVRLGVPPGTGVAAAAHTFAASDADPHSAESKGHESGSDMPLQLPPFAAPAAQDAVAKDHVEGRATAQPSALTPDALRALATAAHDAEASTAKPAAAASDGLAHAAAQPPLSASTASDATSPADAVRRGATPLNVAMRSGQESAPPAMPLVDGSGADGQSDAHDAPREDRHPSPAMAARFAAAISGAEAHASTAAHDATPIFQVPVPQSAATPQQISAAATLPSATPDVPAIASDNVDRVVQSMQVGVKSGVMEATVRLRPEYLGDVTIQLRVEGSGVTAIVRAEAPAVRQWLESQEQTIRSGLAEHGLELTRLVIDPDGQQQPQHDAQQYAEEQRRAALRRRQAMSAQQRFEIVA